MEPNKYQYALFTWGGFYNDHNKAVHGYENIGVRIFDNQADRDSFLKEMEDACASLGTRDACLVKQLYEGYDIENLPVIHRISRYQGKEYYSQRKWSWPEEIGVLEYHAEFKWYPGFNDDTIEEALGVEVDYDKVEIIETWVTGKFTLKYDQ